METIYCIDTSSWIDAKTFYSIRNWPSFWDKLDALVTNKQIISPHEVYDELKQKDDEVFNWGLRPITGGNFSGHILPLFAIAVNPF